MRREAAVLGVVSTYESVALTTRAVPTITHLVMPLPRPVRMLLVAATSWWLAHHFDCTGRRP